jgi:D-glycero-D-manno-heptose 1,7-bisphosphate phosphatase
VPDPNAKRRAVFLDRDGTLCEEVGYLNHISRLRVYPFAAEAIRRLNRAGWPVVVVSNQSGVARKFFPESLVEQVHQRIAAELAAYSAHVDAFYYCPHQKADRCACRKPLPGLIVRASMDLGLEPQRSWMVGDRLADLELGHAVGARTILVLTGYGRGDYEWHHAEWPRQPDKVADDLRGAVDIILEGRAP